MPVTTIDPASALIVVDLQRGVLAYPAAPPVQEVVRRSAALAAAFRDRDLPVVFVKVAGRAPGRTERSPGGGAPGPGWDELVPELEGRPEDHLVTKRTWGAFTGTGLCEHLRARGVTQVVIAGVATSIGVESTARQAHELGFHVALATDAMTDPSAEAHANSVARIFPRLGETGTVEEIVARLPPRAAAGAP